MKMFVRTQEENGMPKIYRCGFFLTYSLAFLFHLALPSFSVCVKIKNMIVDICDTEKIPSQGSDQESAHQKPWGQYNRWKMGLVSAEGGHNGSWSPILESPVQQPPLGESSPASISQGRTETSELSFPLPKKHACPMHVGRYLAQCILGDLPMREHGIVWVGKSWMKNAQGTGKHRRALIHSGHGLPRAGHTKTHRCAGTVYCTKVRG